MESSSTDSGKTGDSYKEIFAELDGMRDQYGGQVDEALMLYMSGMSSGGGNYGMGPMISPGMRMPGMSAFNPTSFGPGSGPRTPYMGGGLEGMLPGMMGQYGGGIQIDIYEQGEGEDGKPKYSITLGNGAGAGYGQQGKSSDSKYGQSDVTYH
jgi:hypothetical protein